MNRRAPEFGCGIIVVGLLAGLAGLCTTLLLRAVEHLTYHYSFGTLLTGVTYSSPVRRALGPMVGGALAGFGWWMLRRRTEVPALAETIAGHPGDCPDYLCRSTPACRCYSSEPGHHWGAKARPANSQPP